MRMSNYTEPRGPTEGDIDRDSGIPVVNRLLVTGASIYIVGLVLLLVTSTPAIVTWIALLAATAFICSASIVGGALWMRSPAPERTHPVTEPDEWQDDGLDEWIAEWDELIGKPTT